MRKILHLAPQNYAGVPYSFFEMHNSEGDYSRLITYHKNQIDFPEDICLNLPLPDFKLARRWRQKKSKDKQTHPASRTPYFMPGNFAENLYFRYTDYIKRTTVQRAIEEYQLNSFDIVHYDGGLDFYRDSSQALRWKQAGKKIVCCYYGSDLRSRGILKELDDISDLNITSEYDHLSLKNDINYLFYPYDPSELPQRQINNNSIIRIIHSPTNRVYKGTDLIIDVINKIKKARPLDFILLENESRAKVLEEKSKCDICIDQVGGKLGGTGYGKAGLESLAMGIPTITNMTEAYAKWLPENPFIIANNSDDLYEALIQMINNEELRNRKSSEGKQWVTKYHSYKQVNKKLKELYRRNKIIS